MRELLASSHEVVRQAPPPITNGETTHQVIDEMLRLDLGRDLAKRTAAEEDVVRHRAAFRACIHPELPARAIAVELRERARAQRTAEKARVVLTQPHDRAGVGVGHDRAERATGVRLYVGVERTELR